VHHRHLVTLLGYCMKGEERLLVLEYMANGTLESNLHGKFFTEGQKVESVFKLWVANNLATHRLRCSTMIWQGRCS
jgi:hypothetical protein